MSLTDQAIAFGEGKVLAGDVRAMLGTLDHGQVFDLLHALIEGDAKAMLEAVRHLVLQVETGITGFLVVVVIGGVLDVAEVLPIDRVDYVAGRGNAVLGPRAGRRSLDREKAIKE